MLDQFALALFLFFLSVGLGGGLYETLVVHPNWKSDPTPQDFARRLQESGQSLAGHRFWPFVSPTTALFAIFNLFAAWHQPTPLRTIWLSAAAVVLIKSVATYTYFVPTMIRKLGRADQLTHDDLARTVKQWTTLSPIRLTLELVGWVAALWAWALLQRV